MDDALDRDLAQLAPQVDEHAARAAFDRRRSRRWARRRVALGTAAVAAVALAGGVTAAILRDDGRGEEVVSAGAGPIGEVEFEVLAMEQAAAFEAMGSLRSAVDAGELAALWSAIAFDGDPPVVDFDESVVVSITIPDDACPPELTGFDRDGDVLTPVFVEPPGGCDEPLIPKTFVVALARGSLEPAFTLRLPGDDRYGYEEQRLTAQVRGDGSSRAAADVDLEVLASGDTAELPGTIRIAADAERFDRLWSDVGLGGAPPDVDFSRSVVVSISVGEGLCPPTLAEVDDGEFVITLTFQALARQEHPDACGDPGPASQVLALDRAAVTPAVRVYLDLWYGDAINEWRMDVAVPADVVDEPSCADVSGLAAQLSQLRSAVDLEPTASPLALLNVTDAAFRGVLTGEFGSAIDPSGGGRGFIGYVVRVEEVFRAPSFDLEVGQEQLVRVPYDEDDVDRFAPLGLAGIPVVVFATEVGELPGGLLAGYEGFAVGCPGGGMPMGLVGEQGEWALIGSLGELADAVRP